MTMSGSDRRPNWSGAICRLGHVMDAWVVDPDERIAMHPDEPSRQKKVSAFCTGCGAPVLFRCPWCGTALTGDIQLSEWGPDQFCGDCGASFPWTDRKAMVAHLSDLLRNEPLDAHDALEAREALLALTAPDDEAPAGEKERAAEKLRRYVSGAWLSVAAPVLRGVLSGELQRRLGLPPG